MLTDEKRRDLNSELGAMLMAFAERHGLPFPYVCATAILCSDGDRLIVANIPEPADIAEFLTIMAGHVGKTSRC